MRVVLPPPSFVDVPTLLDEFRTHVNRHTGTEDAISVASYALALELDSPLRSR